MLSHWCTLSPARHPDIHLVPFCVTACELSPVEQSPRLGGPDPDPREQQGRPAASPSSKIQTHQNSLWLSVSGCRLHATLIFPFPLSSKKRGKIKIKKRRNENEKASKQPHQTTRTGCRVDSRLSSSICTERKTWSRSLPSHGAGGGSVKHHRRQGWFGHGLHTCCPPFGGLKNVPRDEQPPTPEFTAGPCPDGSLAAAVQPAPPPARGKPEVSRSFRASPRQFLGDGGLASIGWDGHLLFVIYFREDSEGARQDSWSRSCGAGYSSDWRAAKPGLVQRKSIRPHRYARAAPGMQGHFVGAGAFCRPPSMTEAGGLHIMLFL